MLKVTRFKYQNKNSRNPLGLAWWCWLGTLECAPPQGLGFDSPRCQFGWASLASSKKNSEKVPQNENQRLLEGDKDYFVENGKEGISLHSGLWP